MNNSQRIEEASDLGYEISLSYKGYRVIYEGEILSEGGEEPKPTVYRRARSQKALYQYRAYTECVLSCIKSHRLIQIERNALDAARFRALLNLDRIRVLGYAGLEKHRKEDGHAHIGLELWTHYNVPEGHESLAETNRNLLTEFLDLAIERQATK